MAKEKRNRLTQEKTVCLYEQMYICGYSYIFSLHILCLGSMKEDVRFICYKLHIHISTSNKCLSCSKVLASNNFLPIIQDRSILIDVDFDEQIFRFI